MDDHEQRHHAHLVRGYMYLRRARIVGAAFAVFAVLHLEYIILPCWRTLGLLTVLVVMYPVQLGWFAVTVLLRRSAEEIALRDGRGTEARSE